VERPSLHRLPAPAPAVLCALAFSALSTLAALVASTPARAEEQEPPGLRAIEAEALRDRALSALARKDLAVARRALERWIAGAPDAREARVAQMRCLLELSMLDEAHEACTALLARVPDDLEATIGLARIAALRAATALDAGRRRALWDAAREAISTAAAIDNAALRATRVHPELRPLREDVAFMMSLVGRARPAPTPGGRDPFRVMLSRTDDAGRRVDPLEADAQAAGDGQAREAELRALAERIPALAAALDIAGQGGDAATITEALTRLEDAARRVTQLCGADRARRERILAPLESRRPLLRAARLRVFYDEGERILATLREASSADDHARACEAGTRLEAHARDMTEKEPLFADAAAELLASARPVLARSRALAEVASLPIEVTAIICGDGRALAIVNRRIVAAGDWVGDRAGAPIPDLHVSEVRKRRVLLTYRGFAFEPRPQLVTP